MMRFKPRIACLTGICAGRRSKGVHLGDVIVAITAFRYDVGKLVAGRLEPELHVYSSTKPVTQWLGDFNKSRDWIKDIKSVRPLSLRYQKEWVLSQLSLQLEGSNADWPDTDKDREAIQADCPQFNLVLKSLRDEKLITRRGRLRLTQRGQARVKMMKLLHGAAIVRKDPAEPQSYIGAIATGNTVVEENAIFDKLAQEKDRRVLGLDMEASAFYQTVQSIDPSMVYFVVKGVSDYADLEKNDDFQPYAAEAAARYVFGFVDHIFSRGLAPKTGPEAKPPRLLRSIQSVLEKGREQEPDFSRKTGPSWVDFEAGYVVESPAVETAIKHLRENQDVILTGPPASGKSVIARNIGYRLALSGYPVFYFDAKLIGSVVSFENLLFDIQELTGPAVCIIEDAHLKHLQCDPLLTMIGNEAREPDARISILYTSRDNRKMAGSSNLARCKEVKVRASDLAVSIITNYADKKWKIQPDQQALKDIEAISRSDLWILAEILDSWIPNRPVDMDLLYNRLRERLDRIGREIHFDAKSMFLVLAALYCYEVPVNRAFLRMLKFDDRAVEKLVDEGEVIDDRHDYLRLHHSSIANLYVRTARAFPELATVLSVQLNITGLRSSYDGYPADIIHSYVTHFVATDETSYDSVLGRLCLGLLKLLNNEKSQDQILHRLKEVGPLRVSIFLSEVSDCIPSSYLSRLIELLRVKLSEEEDIIVLERCVEFLAEHRLKLALSVLEILERRLEREQNLEGLSWVISDLSRANNKVVDNLAAIIESRLEQEPSCQQVAKCLQILSLGSVNTALNMIGLIRSRLEIEEDIQTIGSCVEWLSLGSAELAKSAVGNLTPEKLRGRFVRENDEEKICWAMSGISFGSVDLALDLLREIGLKLSCPYHAEIIARGREAVRQRLTEEFLSDSDNFAVSGKIRTAGSGLKHIGYLNQFSASLYKRIYWPVRITIEEHFKRTFEVLGDLKEAGYRLYTISFTCGSLTFY
jgi:nucleoside phosphorylase